MFVQSCSFFWPFHNVLTVFVAGSSSRLLTGSADQTAKLWDVKTGKALYTFVFDSPARSVDFSVGDKLAVITTDPFMEKTSAIHVKRIAADIEDRKSRMPHVNFEYLLNCLLSMCKQKANK